MRLIEAHWPLHPDKREGLYYDANGKPRSKWYDEEIRKKNMRPSAVARELDMCDELSVEGIVFPEFREEHILRGAFTLNPAKPVIRTFDYGACCAVLFSQKDDYGRILTFHEIVIETGGNAHRLAQAAVSHSADLQVAGFLDFDDPAGMHDQWVSGTTSVQVLNSYGIYPTHKVSGASAQRRRDRIEMIHTKLHDRVFDGQNAEEAVQIHESCTTLIRSFRSGYRHPERSDGKVNLDDIEEVHPFEDVMDCFGMTLMEVLTVAKLPEAKPSLRKANRNPYTGY